MKSSILLSLLILGGPQSIALAQAPRTARNTVFSYEFLQGLPNLSGFSATCVNDLLEAAGSGRTTDDFPHRWVGLYWSSPHAVPEEFSVPGALCMEVHGIDDAGNIVGSYSLDPCDTFNLYCDPTGQRVHGFLRAADGTLTYPIDVPVFGFSSTRLHDINSAGDMVGTYWDGSCKEQAFFLSSGDVFSPIVPPGSSIAQAWTIADDGRIGGVMDAGSPGCAAGWILGPGGFATVIYPGTSWTSVTGISSSRNEIVGIFGLTCPPHPARAFLRRARSDFIEIPPPPGRPSILLTGTNERGDIVGVAGGFGAGAFVGLREPRRP